MFTEYVSYHCNGKVKFEDFTVFGKAILRPTRHNLGEPKNIF